MLQETTCNINFIKLKSPHEQWYCLLICTPGVGHGIGSDWVPSHPFTLHSWLWYAAKSFYFCGYANKTMTQCMCDVTTLYVYLQCSNGKLFTGCIYISHLQLGDKPKCNWHEVANILCMHFNDKLQITLHFRLLCCSNGSSPW